MGANVLVVEDETIIGQDIRRILTGFGYEVPVVARTGNDALRAASLQVPDLVLMDIKLAGSLDGIETAARLQEEHRLPIVYLTSHSDEATLARAKATSPHGFVIKPFTDRELRSCVEIALGRCDLESKAAAETSRLLAENEALTVQGERQKRESERLLVAARTDPLTDAANRLHLQEDLEGIVDRARRYKHHYCAAFCDIDTFKSYNDTFGHLAGDAAIRLVSRAIHEQLRRGDGFYRYGGDEFLVLLPEQSLASAKDCMERVRGAVEALSTAKGGGTLPGVVTISVGIAELRNTVEQDAVDLWLQQADSALYRAKARGRNCVETTEQANDTKSTKRGTT
jgi:diguanylate cyclase (GGDEF)-like protein